MLSIETSLSRRKRVSVKALIYIQMNFARSTSLALASVIPFGLCMPRSEAMMNKEYLEWNQGASIDLIAMGGHSSGCHGGGGNSLKKGRRKQLFRRN